MATTNKTIVKLKLSNGKTSTITLPAPINNTLTDPDSDAPLADDSYVAIKAVYETDDFATVTGADFIIASTTMTTVATK